MTEISEQLKNFDSLWNYEDPASTELKFRELLAEAEESGDPTIHAELLTQIARTEGLRGRFEQAQRTLESAIALLDKAEPSARIRWLLERGRVYNSSGRKEKSRPFFLDAFELAKSNHEDFYAIDAAHMMGIVEPPDQQLEWSLKALKLAEQSEVERARNWKGSLYNNIGWSHHELGEFEAALDYFQKGLEFRQEKEQARETEIARWTVARCLRSLGRTNESLKMQEQLLAEVGPKGDGYIHEEIGECLLALGRDEEAPPHFARAYELLSKDQWLASNESERLARLKELGDTPE